MDKNLIDYFITETNKKLDRLDGKFDDMDDKINRILKFKWQIVGGAGAIAFLVTVAFNILGLFFNHK